MQQAEVEQKQENFASALRNIQEIAKMPTISINGSQQVHNIQISEQINQGNSQNSLKNDYFLNLIDNDGKIILKSHNDQVSKTVQGTEHQSYHNKNQNQQLTLNTNQIHNNALQKQKLKISTQNLEKLSSKEKFDLAILALNQPANQRNPVEQKIIEDTIDSFGYIQKMKKRKPTLAKQVARVVEHERCQKGQAVFFAGQQPEKFYMILRGKVAVLLKKSDAQIAMDRRNGKTINVQNIVDKQNYLISGFDQLLEKRDSVDLGGFQNTPKSPQKNSMPSLFSQQRQAQNINDNNSPLLKNNSYLFVNPNMNGLFGRKSSLQGLHNFNSQYLQKPRNTSIFNSQFFNEKNSNDSSVSTEVNQSPLDLISQIQNNSQNNSIELNTPTLKGSQSRQRHRNTIFLSKNNSVQKPESKQNEFVSKNIHLLPEELVDVEKFYESGVFRYEFAKELEQGSAFGEMGLLLKVPRTATILSLEDTDFVCMSKQNYQQIIKSLENYKLEQKIQFFHQVLHFDLKIEEFGKLCIDFSQKKKFIKDQHIFKEGEKANEVLVIKSGEIELYKNIVGKDGKKKKIQLSYIGAGEIIGVEEIFFQNKERYYNARCLHEVKAYYINKYLFIRLMYEIPDLKSIMEKRAKNKVKWQEFKIQEIIEQQKIEGFLDENIQIDIPQSDKQLLTLESKDRSKKNKKEYSPEEYQQNTNENKQVYVQQDSQAPINIIYANNAETQNQKARGSDLMIPHVRKLHEKSDELPESTLITLKHKVQEGGGLRGFDKIEDQIKKKEKIMEMIEKNSQNLTITQNNLQEKKKYTDPDENTHQVSHLICNENWFDLDKKKQLEQKIADAIKVRRKPPGNTKIHFLKLKQKVNTLPNSQSAAQLTIQTNTNSLTDLSSLPQDIQKKLVKYKKEREKSQFNQYINSLQDITQDELSSPLSNSSQLYSLSALRKLGKPTLSLSTNDKSMKQIFFAQSEASMGEISTPSPTIPKQGGRFGAIHNSLNQLSSYPSQTQKNYQLLNQNKPNNSQTSFSDIKEEPILESQISQKNIPSNQKKFNIFTKSNNIKNQNGLKKQGTLQELDEDYEKDKKDVQVEQKSSLENFHNLENSQQQEQQPNIIQSYYVKPGSQTKIRNKNNNLKINTQQPQQILVNSIQYKSLNEIEQLVSEERQQQQPVHQRSNTNKQSFQSYFNNQNNLNFQDNHHRSGVNLPSIRNSENLLTHLISPEPKGKSYFQSGFKSIKISKKIIEPKSSSFSSKFEKHPPEFIIKSHHFSNISPKKMTQNQLKNQMNSTSTNQISSFTQQEMKQNNNFRSQSFQMNITNKI